MVSKKKIILTILAVAVVALFIAVVVIAEKNGLTIGEQLADWFKGNEEVIEETVEQGTEAVALVA